MSQFQISPFHRQQRHNWLCSVSAAEVRPSGLNAEKSFQEVMGISIDTCAQGPDAAKQMQG